MKIYVVVSAYGIEDSRIGDFIEWNSAPFKRNEINTIIVTDREYKTKCFRTEIVVYPKKIEIMSASKILNYGIRRIEEEAVIIRSDIDIMFTQEILKMIKGRTDKKNGFLCLCANAENRKQAEGIEWSKIEKRWNGYGACLALHRENWHKICGYNENMEGWGYEDVDVVKRAKKVTNMKINAKSPLFHIYHTDRKNTERFPNRNYQNNLISNIPWRNKDWGKVE